MTNLVLNKKNIYITKSDGYSNESSFNSAFSRDLVKKGFLKLRNKKYLKINRDISSFNIANKLQTPSYISLETILSRKSIIPESVGIITSVTTNYPVTIKNELGEFNYKKIKKDLFFGFKIEGGLILAETEKALLDYLYFNGNKIPTNYKIFRAVDKKDFLNTYCITIYKWFQSERFDNLDSLDWKKIKSYSKKFNKIKLNYIVKLLEFYKDSEFYEDYR